MILQVKNVAEYPQQITLHTGEAKTVSPDVALKINTGTDRRLLSFYAALVNYNFEITVLEASGQEMNNYNDALAKLRDISRVADNNRVLQENKVYPSQVNKPEPRPEIYNPKTLDKTTTNSPIPKVEYKENPTQVPRVQGNSDPIVMDSKIGEPIPNFSPQIPEDYPDLPQAVAELNRIENEEAKIKAEQESSDAKWYKLDELDDDTLKRLLFEKFGENTRLKNKSKIIYHIMELADDEGLDVYELVSEYQE